MKRIIAVIVTVAVIGALVNDVSRYAKAQYDISNATTETIRFATRNSGEGRNDNALMTSQFAAERGATVFAFDQDEDHIAVFTQMPVEGTWVLGPIMAAFSGESLSTPYHVQDKETVRLR